MAVSCWVLPVMTLPMTRVAFFIGFFIEKYILQILMDMRYRGEARLLCQGDNIQKVCKDRLNEYHYFGKCRQVLIRYMDFLVVMKFYWVKWGQKFYYDFIDWVYIKKGHNTINTLISIVTWLKLWCLLFFSSTWAKNEFDNILDLFNR